MGPKDERDEAQRAAQSDELREQDVTSGDRLDDRVEEAEGMPVHTQRDDILPPANAVPEDAGE